VVGGVVHQALAGMVFAQARSHARPHGDDHMDLKPPVICCDAMGGWRLP
jgi:hypothetical protein